MIGGCEGLKGNAPGFGGWERFEGDGIGFIVLRGGVEVKGGGIDRGRVAGIDGSGYGCRQT